MAFSPSNQYFCIISTVEYIFAEKICGNFILWELIFADCEKNRNT